MTSPATYRCTACGAELVRVRIADPVSGGSQYLPSHPGVCPGVTPGLCDCRRGLAVASRPHTNGLWSTCATSRTSVAADVPLDLASLRNCTVTGQYAGPVTIDITRDDRAGVTLPTAIQSVGGDQLEPGGPGQVEGEGDAGVAAGAQLVDEERSRP